MYLREADHLPPFSASAKGRGELQVLLPYTKVCSAHIADRYALISVLPGKDFMSTSFSSVQQAPFSGQQFALPVQNEFPPSTAINGAPHWEISLGARKPWQPVLPAQAEPWQQKTHQFSLRWLINYTAVCKVTPWDVKQSFFGQGVSVFIWKKQGRILCIPVHKDYPFTWFTKSLAPWGGFAPVSIACQMLIKNQCPWTNRTG